MKHAIVVLCLVLILVSGCGNTSKTAEADDDSSKAAVDTSGNSDNAAADIFDGPGVLPEISGLEPTQIKPSKLEAVQASDLLPLCLGFEDSRYRTSCAAAFNKDIKMCADIIDPHGREIDELHEEAICKGIVAITKKDITICDSTNNQFYSVDSCYEDFAIGTKQKSICDKISSENGQVGCKARFDAEHSDVSVEGCERIGAECYLKQAWKTRDKAYCEAYGEDAADILKEASRMACEAMILGDESTCTPLKQTGVNEWWYCKRLGQFGKANPSEGQFYPEHCGDNWDCQKMLVQAMVWYAGSR